jgi:hypothetical protein
VPNSNGKRSSSGRRVANQAREDSRIACVVTCG